MSKDIEDKDPKQMDDKELLETFWGNAGDYGPGEITGLNVFLIWDVNGNQSLDGCFIQTGALDQIGQAQFSVLKTKTLKDVQGSFQDLYLVHCFMRCGWFHIMNYYFEI